MKCTPSQRILFVFSVALGLLITSCGVAFQQNAQQLARTANPSDYGPPPPTDYPQQIQTFLQDRLKDPESARYQFGQPQRNVIQRAVASPNPMLVWTTPIKVNSKNSFGGYTGFETMNFAWRNGKMIAFWHRTVTPGELQLDISHWEYL